MVQVKLIRNESTRIERDINEFFIGLTKNPGYQATLIDIKWDHIPEKDIYTALIIYNYFPIPPQTPLVT